MKSAVSTFLSVALLSITFHACSASAAVPQDSMAGMKHDAQGANKPMPSPPANAEVKLSGKSVSIHYNAPSMRGRKIMGEVVPYGKVWRTGANPATTLVTQADLRIGTIDVPAGTYTIYTLPGADQWLLIVNKQTGQWGTVYNESMDLGRTPMSDKPLSQPQEVMSISFENTRGNSTELHVRWENTDRFVAVSLK